MSRAYGYGLINSKLNTLQSLVLTSGSGSQDLQGVLTAGNTASLDIQIQDANSTTLVKPTGLEISDSIGGIPKLNTVQSNLIQIDQDESSTTGTIYSAQYREYGTALNTTTTASGTFAASYAYDQLTLNKVIGPTTTDLLVTSNQITSNDVLGITANTLNLNGQTVFDIPPHCAVDPTTGIDLANKGYVDSLVGQYSGGYNLYFNYSVTDPTYGTFQSLGQTVVAAAQQTVVNNITSGTQEVARFITLPLGITTIPIGLWDALIYGAVSGTGGDVHYYFELYKKTALNVDTLLVTSGISPDVNASPSTNPTAYTMNATITAPITLDLTDRLFMILYVTKTGMNTINVTTYFQNDYYSFTQSTLNAGTTLLSSNNTWTGTNKFDLAVSADSIQTNAVGTTANLFTTQTTGDFNLLTSKTTGNVNILTGGSRGGTTNILTASGTSNTLNIGSGSLSTQFNGNLFSSNLDQVGTLNVGTTSATTLTLGKTTNTATNLRGTSVSIDAGIAGPINIGGASTNLLALGRVGLASITATATNMTFTGICGFPTSLNSPSATFSTVLSGNYNSNAPLAGTAEILNNMTNATAGGLNMLNVCNGFVNILTNPTRTATTEMLKSTSNNAFNLGNKSGATGMTFTLDGIVSNFNATTNNFASGLTTPSLSSALTTTPVSLYTANTGGQVDILTGTRTAATNMLTGTGANTFTMGSGTTGLSYVLRGLSAIFGSATNAFTTGLTTPSIETTAVGTGVSLYTANTTGIVDFLTSTSRTGFLNIQSGGSNVNTINIGNDNSNTNVRGLKVSTIDNIAVGGMSIGATNTNAITFNNKPVSGLTMAANQFVTLGANTSLPAVNQIGYIYTIASPNGAGFVDNASLTTGVEQEYGSIAGIPAGVYMVSANMNMQQVALTTITSVVVSITASGNNPYIDRKAFINGAIAVNNYNISGIMSRGSTMTMKCTLTVSFTGSAPKMSIDSFKFNIVRIA